MMSVPLSDQGSSDMPPCDVCGADYDMYIGASDLYVCNHYNNEMEEEQIFNEAITIITHNTPLRNSRRGEEDQ